MFKCRYKFELEDSIIGAKYAYKSQRRKQDKIIAVLVPLLMLAMVLMLIYDIVKGNSFTWDIILLVALVVLEILYIIIPFSLVQSQKKAYKKQNLADMEALEITIDDNICVETLFKDGVEVAKNVHNLKSLTSYLEDTTRIVLIFNKVEFVCLRKNKISPDVEKLKTHLENAMIKATSKSKKKKR